MNGKSVFLTGAAGGIGQAVARRFAQAGASVALSDLDPAALQRLADEINAKGDGKAIAVPCDVTDAEACRAAIDTTVNNFGGIDVLINNAGRTHLSRFAETDLSVIRKVMEINFFGAVHCAKFALPHLQKSHGSIALLSSVAGFAPLSGRIGYSASKHALHGFFESLHGELIDDEVNVLMVCPSFVDTPIGANALGGDGGTASNPRTSTGKPMTPEYVADRIYQSIVQRQRLLLLAPVAKLSYYLSRITPRFYERMMIKRLLAEQPPVGK